MVSVEYMENSEVTQALVVLQYKQSIRAFKALYIIHSKQSVRLQEIPPYRNPFWDITGLVHLIKCPICG